MRLKLLIVFLVSFAVIFVFRAYGDYTTGGFPAFGLMNFLYWNILYSLIPLLPAVFAFQIISPPISQSKQNEKVVAHASKKLLPIASRVIITILAIILGAWAGGYIGLLFTSDRSELDALTGGLYGAPIGAAIGLMICWFFFYKRKI
jgi:beta-lactamase regulating signal transducer with metallopeptidase domain